MSREGCIKIKTPTSSMVRNCCSQEYYEVQVTTLYPITPQWHHTQFKKLSVMVENFGMLHFFLTLTFDETSNLRWKEIEDIENLACFSITHFLGRII
jgi:hypothetical protein